MRSMEARKEEVYRRGQRRIQARRRRWRIFSGACGAAALCVLVIAAALPPRDPEAVQDRSQSAIPELQSVPTSAMPEPQSVPADVGDKEAELAESVGPIVTVSLPGQEAIRLSNPAPAIDALQEAFADTATQNRGAESAIGDEYAPVCTITVTLETGETERYQFSGATLTRLSDGTAVTLSAEARNTLEALLEAPANSPE